MALPITIEVVCQVAGHPDGGAQNAGDEYLVFTTVGGDGVRAGIPVLKLPVDDIAKQGLFTVGHSYDLTLAAS